MILRCEKTVSLRRVVKSMEFSADLVAVEANSLDILQIA